MTQVAWRGAPRRGATVVAVDVGAEGGVDATVTSNNQQAGQLDGIRRRYRGENQVLC